MSDLSTLMDASQTYHLASGQTAATEIHVHDEQTWNNLTGSFNPGIAQNPADGSWSYKKILLRLVLDPEKDGDFTFFPVI